MIFRILQSSNVIQIYIRTQRTLRFILFYTDDTLITKSPKPCIVSIKRYDPLTEKTNASQVTFLVTFNGDVNVSIDDFVVNNGDVVNVESVSNSTPYNAWYVSVDVDSNTTDTCGKIVKITEVVDTAEFIFVRAKPLRILQCKTPIYGNDGYISW